MTTAMMSSDRPAIRLGLWENRARLIARGTWVQAFGIGVVIVSTSLSGFAAGGVLLGIGTAMVYPTLSIGDVALPSGRASSVGVYRLWRDVGYVVGLLCRP